MIRDARGRLSEGLTYHYLSPLQLHAVSRGEAVEEGKDGALTITGRHFPDTPQLACRIEGTLYKEIIERQHTRPQKARLRRCLERLGIGI